MNKRTYAKFKGAALLSPRKKNAEEIEAFIPVLRKWSDLHENYCKEMQEGNKPEDYDDSFFYGEQSQVSLLAAATWMKGGLALAEFSHKKRELFKHGGRKKHKTFSGRADLYAKKGMEYEFYIEAKYEALSLNPRRDWSSVFEKLDEKAQKSASQTKEKGVTTLKLGFVSMYLPKKDLNRYRDLRVNFIQELCNYKSAACAWFFLPEFYENVYSDKYVNVGTALFLQDRKSLYRHCHIQN